MHGGVAGLSGLWQIFSKWTKKWNPREGGLRVSEALVFQNEVKSKSTGVRWSLKNQFFKVKRNMKSTRWERGEILGIAEFEMFEKISAGFERIGPNLEFSRKF